MNIFKKRLNKPPNKGKSRFSKINAWLHLWLGLASGIVVFIMGITGCILVFEHEIKELTSPWLKVEAQSADRVLPPSKIYAAVKKELPGKDIHGLWYNGLDKTIKVDVASDSLIYVNPYNGKITGMVDHEDFFHEIDEGHRYVWLGREVGTAVTSWATLIFFFLLISGIILWFPKKWNKTTINNSFKIKWSAKFKRLNYDLHNVLGFYSLLLAFLIALTGLIMSFHWVRESTYWITGGFSNEKEKKEVVAEIKSDTLLKPKYDMLTSADIIFNRVRKEIAKQNHEAVIIHFPDEPKDNFYACTDMHNGNWRDLYFDQKTLELLPNSKKYIGDEKFHDWMSRSNYSLHVGAIGGITTKILYFTASLICASLPITGFYIWWGRKKKTKKS
ncbi:MULTISPECIES: PepSY domain-containing protein [Flavobacterium]|uniref:PepSY-associated TM helix domain-containing protein n=1 Tax=Flavobacterium ginsengisoli TaxID=871694 RepID=A0ABP7F2L3_9FLAO|nr:PepSY-associated TM helix domain-containing protein [Flavobacterium sp. IB48]MBJ2123026.1 PepSY domain-containing protein [Flavobacterium sp. IB48]